MARYELRFKASVAKDLRALSGKDVERILVRCRRLAHDPRGPGCEKLVGQERYRVRQGDYRILYEIHDRAVLVVIVKVAHRREACRGK